MQTIARAAPTPPAGRRDPGPDEEDTGQRLRGALRAFATGVTVVTSVGIEAPCAVTANSFTPVSLTPPLVLVCLNVASGAARTIARNGVFAVNVLSAGQERLSRRFASQSRPRGTSAFAGVAIRAERTGAPILEGVVCWFDCRYAGALVAGDHIIVLGEVVDFADDPSGDPLVFHAGRYRVVGDPAAPRPGLLALPNPIPERR